MFKKISSFIRETRTELIDKTTWPTKDAVLSSTVVVIVSIIVVSIGLFVVDMGVSQVVQFVMVRNVDDIAQYVNVYTFLLFIVCFFVGIYMYAKIKRRLQ